MTTIPTDAKAFAKWRKKQTFATPELAQKAHQVRRDRHVEEAARAEGRDGKADDPEPEKPVASVEKRQRPSYVPDHECAARRSLGRRKPD